MFRMRSLFDKTNQELPLVLSERVPITLGSLEISVELGCDRLHFGKEFIDKLLFMCLCCLICFDFFYDTLEKNAGNKFRRREHDRMVMTVSGTNLI